MEYIEWCILNRMSNIPWYNLNYNIWHLSILELHLINISKTGLMETTLSSLAVPDIAIMTTSSTANDDNVSCSLPKHSSDRIWFSLVTYGATIFCPHALCAGVCQHYTLLMLGLRQKYCVHPLYSILYWKWSFTSHTNGILACQLVYSISNDFLMISFKLH